MSSSSGRAGQQRVAATDQHHPVPAVAHHRGLEDVVGTERVEGGRRGDDLRRGGGHRQPAAPRCTPAPRRPAARPARARAGRGRGRADPAAPPGVPPRGRGGARSGSGSATASGASTVGSSRPGAARPRPARASRRRPGRSPVSPGRAGRGARWRRHRRPGRRPAAAPGRAGRGARSALGHVQPPAAPSSLRRGSHSAGHWSPTPTGGGFARAVGGLTVVLEFDVLVEIPKGERNKYEVDHESGRMRLDRTLFTSTQYPADYGYIENTLGLDGDPLDALVLLQSPDVPRLPDQVPRHRDVPDDRRGRRRRQGALRPHQRPAARAHARHQPRAEVRPAGDPALLRGLQGPRARQVRRGRRLGRPRRGRDRGPRVVPAAQGPGRAEH